MELRQLRYFVTVAEELHFGRAAERLHIVQPAVSQQLRRLETELGVTLVERSTRHVALTAAGERFLPEARAVLAAAERARQAVAPADRAALRLGTSTGLGDRLTRVLEELKRRAPDVTVELVRVPAADRLRRLMHGTLDAAFLRGVAGHPGVEVVPLWTEPLAVALPTAHPLATAERLRLDDLAALPVRLPAREANPPLVDMVVAACRTAGFEPVRAPAMDDQDMLAAIAAGPPTWTVYYAAQAELLAARGAGVTFRALADPVLAMPTGVAVRAGQDGDAVAALLAACRAVGGL